MKEKWSLDIETIVGVFTATFIQYDTDETVVFEISRRKNQLAALREFWFTRISFGIGFNSISFDNLVVNWLVDQPWDNKDGNFVCGQAAQVAQEIINHWDDDMVREKYKPYRYSTPFEPVDIFLYWSKMLRQSMQLSLKAIAAQIKMSIIEMPIHYSQAYLTDAEIEEVIRYNINDVQITKQLAKLKRDEINLRIYSAKQYGFKGVLSWDGVKIGYNVLLHRLSKRSGISVKQLRNMQSPKKPIVVKDILLPFLTFSERNGKQWVEKFDNTYYQCFKTFGDLFDYLNTITIQGAGEIACRVFYKGRTYDIKSGGIHSVHCNEKVAPLSNQIYRDVDVSSYYPTFGVAWNIVPEHFKELGLAEELGAIRLERLADKAAGNVVDAEVKKLAMNGGFFGNTNNEYTAMYDPTCMFTITLNGQLALCMLCEQLELANINVDMCNTDGVTVLMDKSQESQFKAICAEWERVTRMELESVDYDLVVRRDINNYLAIYQKKGIRQIKQKGIFVTDPEIGKSTNNLVEAKALKAYYFDGIEPEVFIRNHTDPYDFCSSRKIAKTYKVYYRGERIQQLNRYYVATNSKGAYLYKQKEGKKTLENVEKGKPICLLNEQTDKSATEFGIQYSYYLKNVRAVINQFEPNQMSLFSTIQQAA